MGYPEEIVADQELWDSWLNGPACKIGAHPTVFHHQHIIGPATWHCYCGKVQNPAFNRFRKKKND